MHLHLGQPDTIVNPVCRCSLGPIRASEIREKLKDGAIGEAIDDIKHLKFLQTAKACRNFLGKNVPTKDECGEVRELRQKLWQIESANNGRNLATVRQKAVGEAKVINRDRFRASQVVLSNYTAHREPNPPSH
nr:hypothetical protein Iba_chr03cCG1390 [Ipomoea batatas]